MRSVYEQRRENLRSLSRQWGEPTSLSKKLGLDFEHFRGCSDPDSRTLLNKDPAR